MAPQVERNLHRVTSSCLFHSNTFNQKIIASQQLVYLKFRTFIQKNIYTKSKFHFHQERIIHKPISVISVNNTVEQYTKHMWSGMAC